MRVVREAAPGLAYARRCAMNASGADYVCFVDDDNLVAPDYLEKAAAILAARRDIGVLVSHSELYELARPPAWFAQVSRSYAVGAPAARDGFLPPWTAIWGAGFFVSRAAWREAAAKGFAPLLEGRKGEAPLAGEDSELSLALNLLGWKTYYSSALRLRHAIDPGRMNLRTLKAISRGFGVSTNVLQAYRALLEDRARGWVKRRDLPYAALLVWQLLRAAARSFLARDLARRTELWRAQGCLEGFLRLGLRPSRVLNTAFLRRVASEGPGR
jgi:glycosyltransferase involved in cell wall biosynthesis